MALTNEELEHLLAFVGYGALDAKVWFLGMEEAGGGEQNIRARLQFREVEDCAHAHTAILGVSRHHLGRRVIQRTWRGMCYIMLRLAGEEPTTERIRAYQATQLGSLTGSSLLCELMPIPKPKLNQWGYEALLPQFASAEAYYQAVMPRRLAYLRQVLRAHRPALVIGYGRRYWEQYKALFEPLPFARDGSFLVARAEGMTVILTDHLTARTMNGKLDEVVALAQSGRAAS